MADWGNDPELMATFRAEVEDRLASLSTGLLTLESAPQTKKVIGSLFRDAHTVKGSARMLGLDAVVAVAHHMEDLLGALKDGRFKVRRDIIDVLLASGDAVGRSLPGSPSPAPPEHLEALERISGMVDETTTAAKEISIATQQQRSASDQVVAAMNQVSDVSRQYACLLYTSPSPRDRTRSRMPSSA